MKKGEFKKRETAEIMINLHIYFSEMRHESRILKITDSIARAGLFDRIYILGVASSDLPASQKLDKTREIQRFDAPILSLKNRVSAIRAALWYLLAIYKVLRIHPSCLSVHSVSFLPMAMIVKLFQPSTKIIYETHELETETNNASRVKRNLRRIIERLGYFAIDHTFAVSPSIKNWYVKKYKTNRVSLTLNCPPFRKINANNYLRNHFGISDEKKIFIYQGLFTSGRGIEQIVTAFTKLPEQAVLILLGFGPDERHWMNKAELMSNLYVHPAVPSEDVLNITASADCGISFIQNTSLSYKFSMPNKLFEFIQARIPVIVSPTLDQSDFVRETGVGIICNDFTAKGVEDACRDFLSGLPSEINSRLAKVAHDYCWETQETRVIDVYSNLIGHK